LILVSVTLLLSFQQAQALTPYNLQQIRDSSTVCSSTFRSDCSVYKGTGNFTCSINGACSCGSAEFCLCDDNNGNCNCDSAKVCICNGNNGACKGGHSTKQMFCEINNGNCNCGLAKTCSCSASNGRCCTTSRVNLVNGYREADVEIDSEGCASSASSGDLGPGEIVAIVIGSILFVLFICVAVFCCCPALLCCCVVGAVSSSRQPRVVLVQPNAQRVPAQPGYPGRAPQPGYHAQSPPYAPIAVGAPADAPPAYEHEYDAERPQDSEFAVQKAPRH